MATSSSLHGSGFTPYARVTVSLNGVHVLSAMVTVDAAGMFNYAFDQGHHFFVG